MKRKLLLHVLYILRVKNVYEVKYLAYEFPLHGRGINTDLQSWITAKIENFSNKLQLFGVQKLLRYRQKNYDIHKLTLSLHILNKSAVAEISISIDKTQRIEYECV